MKCNLPYLLDQTPLSNCCHTSGHAVRNSCRSRILTAASIRVAHAHVNKPRARMTISKSIHDRYKNTGCPEKFCIFGGTEGDHHVKSLEENEETDWRYHFVAKRRLIKLEGLLQNQATASQLFVNWLFSKPLQLRKILPITLSSINTALD